jgi:c-di-GMP-related signal transduction protein
MMDIYVARQPIFTVNQEVCAYELLYRGSNQNSFSNIDGDQATSDVINSFLEIGVEELSEGKPCFINFTETLLEYAIPTYFQPNMIVVEVLETVKPTDKIIKICRTLKEQGYKIALDDFEMKFKGENFNELLKLADIIKVDIRQSSRSEQLNILTSLKSYNLEFLAEKVETREEYEQCLKDGYQYFQGYFFSKPMILSTNEMPVLNHNILIILKELSQSEPNINRITEIIEADLSLSYKLLKLINSPIIDRVYKIKSIKQAIVLLGLKELRKWIFLLSFREKVKKNNQVPDEAVKMCFTRAKASELIALNMGKGLESSSYFLVGMFSLMDTLMKQPIEKILKQLPLEEEIKETILGHKTLYSDVYDLVVGLERAQWDEIDRLTEIMGIEKQKLFHLYKESMIWTKEVMLDSIKQNK